MSVTIQEKKHLSAKGMLRDIREQFSEIQVTQNVRGAGKLAQISLTDCLMSGLAVFSLKYSSLLQFDKQSRQEESVLRHNLKTLYQVEEAPCDTQLRERLDSVNPDDISPAFDTVFSSLQRGKVLEKFQFLEGYYLISCDGTGYFSSKEIHCKNCCIKNHRNGSKTYYHQMLSAAIVYPGRKEVIPLCPEPIIRGDGSKKNDCERNACRRFLIKLRKRHPHLKIILVEDALAANGPHLKLCIELNIRFIVVVKEDGNKSLFSWIEGVEKDRYEVYNPQDNCTYRIETCNNIPLNDANPDLLVNFVECWVFDKEGKEKYHNTWVTNLEVTEKNALSIVRGGRARWKIENETFNTLKNQGYNFEHNYGHGKEHLSTNFARLMLLAFLIDQVQQISCSLFQSALNKYHAKIVFWEMLRNTVRMFRLNSWKSLYEALAKGVEGKLIDDSS